MKKINRTTKVTLFVVLVMLCSFANFIRTEIVKGAEGPTYLSDIDYIANQSSTAWKTILKDKAGDDNKISVKIDGSLYTFDKGMWAHATSTLVYDISAYDYKYFTAYIGLNSTAASSSNGVKFYIYTSVDGTTWDLKTDSDPKVTKPGDNAEYVRINIKGAKYLKLVADDNGSNGNDHSVYADAKLTNEEIVNVVNDIEYYDNLIKTKYANASLENKEYELALLQREFIKNVGQYTIKRFVEGSADNQKVFDWLFNDVDNLRLYIVGGAPDGTYINSLNVLSDLYKNYSADLSNTTLLNNKWYPNMTYGDLYKKMMITLSLTHSTRVSLWMQPGEESNQSDAVTRYKIYKDLHKDGKFVVSDKQDHTPWFEALNVEEMRFVLNNIIDDEEILWLYDYTQKRINQHPGEEEKYLQPHPYMKYIWPDYAREDFHNVNNQSLWDEKYEGVFTKYNITFKPGVYKLWMNLENGAVCGGISKIGSNIRGVHGTPSSVISQPGHAAIIYYRKLDDGRGYWTIDNDVSGWAMSGKTERLSLRMPLGWGDEAYITKYKDTPWLATYILLAQGALNDFDNYEKSRELLILADVYKNDTHKLESVYRSVIQAEPLNIDAWYGLINVYRAENRSEEDFYKLSNEIMETLKYYPLPMYHLTEEIESELKTPSYTFKFSLDQTATLVSATNVTSSESIQATAVKDEAKYLLGQSDPELATFSFDGADAGKIVLSSKYDGVGINWEYSLNGKSYWNKVAFTADEEHKVALSKDQLNTITAENDIYIHVVGTSYDDANLYKIDITEQSISDTDLYANDLENRIIGVNSSMEWRIKNTTNWTSYSIESPELSGDKTVEVRIAANGTKLTSPLKEYNFTENDNNIERRYVPTYHLSIASVSSEATSNQGDAKYSIDGNMNTRWHSDWNGHDTEKYIVIKLDRAIALSAIEYMPSGGGNGKILTAKILGSTDGKTFTDIGTATWENTETLKNIEFPDKPVVKYVKIVGEQTSSASSLSFISARMFNFYEDASALPSISTVDIEYSNTERTNKNVTARLVNVSPDIEITNNNGNDSHIFTENGEFTFTFRDKVSGIEESATAKVDWIDKTVPTAKASYRRIEKEVVVTFKVSEDVYILDSNNKPTSRIEIENEKVKNIYFLDSNGKATYVVEYNEKGVETSITVLNKIERPKKITYLDEYGAVTSITYFDDDGNIIEKPSDISGEDAVNPTNVKVLNPLTYTFSSDGSYNFKIMDMAGNINLMTANISNTGPIAVINYDILNETTDPVTATISFIKLSTTANGEHEEDTDVIITSEGGNTHVFLDNGSFIFEYRDSSGHEGKAIATVDWIKEVEVVEPTPEPEDNTKPGDSTNSGESTKPSDSTNSSESTKPSSSTSSSSTTKPNDSTNSSSTTKPNDSTNSSENQNSNTEEKPNSSDNNVNDKLPLKENNNTQNKTEKSDSFIDTIIDVLVIGAAVVAISFILVILKGKGKLRHLF